MRNGEHLAARILLVSGHIGPQPFRILLAKSTKGNGIAHFLRAIPEHDHPVEIVAVRHRCIFKAHEGGEFTRLIILIHGLSVFFPEIGCAISGFFGIGEGRGQRPLRRAIDQLARHPQ